MSLEKIFFEIYIVKREGCLCANAKECEAQRDFGQLFSHHLSTCYPAQRRKTDTSHLIKLILWETCTVILFQSALSQNVMKSQHDKRS